MATKNLSCAKRMKLPRVSLAESVRLQSRILIKFKNCGANFCTAILRSAFCTLHSKRVSRKPNLPHSAFCVLNSAFKKSFAQRNLLLCTLHSAFAKRAVRGDALRVVSRETKTQNGAHISHPILQEFFRFRVLPFTAH